jgi:ABC-type lipoprotein export system ATPase subunit
MSICLDNTTCFALDSLLDNITRINLNSNTSELGQQPFTGYASSWLAGVIVSIILIALVLTWTLLQNRFRERSRLRDLNNAAVIEQIELSDQFAESAVSTAAIRDSDQKFEKVMKFTPSLESHIQCLNSANDGEAPMNIEFRHLCLTLMRGKGKVVLENVSGVLAAASMTAILGPSGCGKTTLLTAIAGRAHYGKLSGVVKVNDVEQDIEKFRTVVGFVPQDDIMIRALTVRQVLTFSGLARLPRNLSLAEKMRVVDSVIAILGLEKIQHQRIGDENIRGISGGQRKRVNIGIELVSAPLALFLDEPTSGSFIFGLLC